MVRWFHRDLSGLDAETLLKGRGVHGSFLARPSRKNQGDFSLSVSANSPAPSLVCALIPQPPCSHPCLCPPMPVCAPAQDLCRSLPSCLYSCTYRPHRLVPCRVGDQVTHIRIQNSGDFYDLYGGEKFATLTELVEYYTQQQGVLQDRDGTIIHLKYPLNCSDPTSESWGKPAPTPNGPGGREPGTQHRLPSLPFPPCTSWGSQHPSSCSLVSQSLTYHPFHLTLRKPEKAALPYSRGPGHCNPDLCLAQPYASWRLFLSFSPLNILSIDSLSAFQSTFPCGPGLTCPDTAFSRWYHGHMSGGQAETLLQAKGEPWTFLVRESLSQPGDFVLSVLSDQPKAGPGSPLRVTHIKVMCEGGRYTVGGSETFDSLTDLVEHFKKTGIEEASGAFVYLRQPYYATRVNAADIENRVLELNKKQESEDTAKAGFWEEFEVLGGDPQDWGS
ncbi:hypothetical protein P7K49_019215 [Saguinus oedipus]|uniref:protein-tyrosine-phosphatase n=1 Tax=Saguinus oedipus TaxID=9490 RepID=A0ABQ9UWP8_SAGOE|nr:hypothetical protein P7K49_019215 [Saguinus oedipus]